MKTTMIALSALFVTSASLAQPGAGGPGAGQGMPANDVIMERNDANEDGEITQAEAEAAETALGQNFSMFDLDDDGKVTGEELDTMREQMQAGGPAGAGGQ